MTKTDVSRTILLLSLTFAMSLFSVSAKAVALIKATGSETVLERAYSLFFSGDYQQAEQLAESLMGTEADADGSVSLLLAAVLQTKGSCEEAQSLLQNHDGLVALYNEEIPIKDSEENWSDTKKLRFYQLKALSGRLRYHLGQHDDSVLKDLIAGVTYEENEHLVAIPDMEALQFAALILFAKGKYEQAVHYWNRLLSASAKRETMKGVTQANKSFHYATKYNIACAYAKLGNVEQTLIWLRRSLEYDRSRRIKFIMEDSDLDNVRGDERFKKFIIKLQNGLEAY